MPIDTDKRLAAEAAVAEVTAGMYVGLGTGSTAAHAIAAIGARVRDGLTITAVGTSLATEALARAAGIAVVPFDRVARVDLTIDGIDEADAGLRAIKGAGGALLREKIVATASARMIAIADGSKRVAALGRGPVPLEILPFARAFVLRVLADMGATANVRTTRSDQGNLLVDAAFGPIADPAALATALDAVPGILGHGLFLTEIDRVYFAADGAVERHDRT